MITKTQQELSPEMTDRLEEAVMEIFSTVDFHQASMRDVAKRADLSLATIYKYYGSKENLVFSVVDQRLGVLTERMIDHLQGIKDLKEKLRKVFWLQLDYYERHPDLGRIIFMTVPLTTWMADETFKQQKMIGLYMDVLRQGQAEGALDPNAPAKVLLDVMHGFVQRCFFMWIYRGRKESLAGRADMLFELIWRAMANPAT
jgi:AcrR family transcriptional regulator